MKIESFAPGTADRGLIEEIGRFRYAIFVEEMGFDDPYADRQARTVIDPLDAAGYQIIARDRGVLVGAVRLNLIRDGDFPAITRVYDLDAFTPDERARCGLPNRLMVAPRYRSGIVTSAMIIRGLAIARATQCDWCLLICRPEIKTAFLTIGCEIHKAVVEHPIFGARTVLKYNVLEPRRDHSKLAAFIDRTANMSSGETGGVFDGLDDVRRTVAEAASGRDAVDFDAVDLAALTV